MNTKIVNLVGGPCCGKSTTAGGLFSAMKLQTSEKLEIVTEVIKDYVYDENTGAMNDQILITAQQNHRLKRLVGKVDFVISDASLLNGVVYNEFYSDIDNISTELSKKLFDQYDNIVFLLPRKPDYDQYGRTQSLAEAKEIDRIFVQKLDELKVQYFDMREFTHEEMPQRILEVLADLNEFSVKSVLQVFKKEYDAESLIDVEQHIMDALDSQYNPVMNCINISDDGFHEGTFEVTITWKP